MGMSKEDIKVHALGAHGDRAVQTYVFLGAARLALGRRALLLGRHPTRERRVDEACDTHSG
jgi:hypothetical protein